MSRQNSDGIKSYTINMISCVSYRILQLTVLVWVNQYLLRRISAEEYSIYPLMLSLVVFCGFFKTIFTSGIARFLVEADAKGDTEGVTRIASSMFPILMAVGTTIVFAGVICSWQIDKVIDIKPEYVSQARLMLVMLAGSMGFSVVTTPFSSGLFVRQRFVVINIIDLSSEVLRVILLLILLIGIGPQVMWLVVASVFGNIVSTICNVIAGHRALPAARFNRRLVSGDQMKTLLSFSAWSCTQGFSGIAAKWLPLIFLNRFASAVDVAMFHLANLADLQVKRLVTAAMRPAMPALTVLHALGKREYLRELYYTGGRYHMWVMLLPAAPLFIFGTDFMALYAGEEYRATGYVIMAFFLRYPITSASAMYFRISHATGNVRMYYLTDGISQFISIGAFYLALRFGEGGVVSATWWATAMQSVYNLLVVCPLGLSSVEGGWLAFFRKTIIPGVLPLAASTAYCLILKNLLVPNSWSAIILACASGTAVNLLIIGLVACGFSDRLLVQKFVSTLRRRFPSFVKSNHSLT